MSEQIYGIVPPTTTPFRSDNTIDEEALRTAVSYLIETAKVHGLAVGGSTGEGHALSIDEVRQISAAAAEVAGGRVPVITGIIADSTTAVIEKARAVRDLEITALQVTPVHYLFRPDDDAMLKFFDDVATQSGFPVVIYNVVPWSYLSPQLLARILAEVDGVVGVKQSAGDMKLLADLLLDVGDKGRIMTAVDALLYPSFSIGAHGAIAAVLTAAPTLCVQLWDAVAAQDHALALDLHQKLLPIWNAINGDNLPANVKFCMERQGRPAGLPRAPMPPTSATQEGPILDALANAGLIEEPALA
jgi:4-hydroxy-tetrahydrodipicolinate synthase